MRISKRVTTIILIGFIGITIPITVWGKDKNSLKENLEVQNFYYKKGYKDASEKFYKKGYEDAIKDIKKRLAAFKTRHDAIEASKYLSITGKITYPEVVKIRDGNGGYKIKIIPPRIEKAFSVYDLIKVPSIDNRNSEDSNIGVEDINTINNEIKHKKVTNAFYSQEDTENNNNKVIKSINTLNNERIVKVFKNRKTQQLLNAANLTYSEGSSYYQVYFKSPFEKEKFCNGVGEQICQ